MHYRFNSQSFRAKVLVLALGLSVLVSLAAQNRKPIKPGWNLFSKEQDVQLGHEAAVEIEKEVQVVNDRQLNDYVNSIGQRSEFFEGAAKCDTRQSGRQLTCRTANLAGGRHLGVKCLGLRRPAECARLAT